MNIVVCGHVDHGKSTLIGRLLYDGEQITDSKVSEVQKLAEEMKKKFEFAYFVDAFGDEISQERTIDTTSLRFKSTKRTYTITDVPGHREFIKNMLTGASKADAAILVVAADEGIKEQTKRHLFLLSLLGIKNLIIFINKMDKVDNNIMVYRKLSREVGTDLTRGYGFKIIRVVPGSALTGDGVYFTSIPWVEKFNESTLVEELDRLEEPLDIERPLRFLVQDIYEGTVVGKVVSGTLGLWNTLEFRPSYTSGKVVDIKGKGRSIGIKLLQEQPDLVSRQLPKRGDVGSKEPVKQGRDFKAEITLIGNKIWLGERLLLKCGTAKVPFSITRITTKIDTETGQVLKGEYKELKEEESAIVQIHTEDSIVVERFSETPELGRFVISKDKKIIGLGVVL